jgi:type IV pilus assembly protein PilN
MPRINLLPWREELRQKRKKDFLTAVVGAVLVGGLLAYAGKLGVQAQIRAQEGRNNILQAEIAELDMQIAEILGLENQKERLLARMEIIEQLQRARPEVVHLFVSALMRNIDSSEWLRNPGLDVVETIDLGPMRNAQFTLFMQQISMTEEEEVVTP